MCTVCFVSRFAFMIAVNEKIPMLCYLRAFTSFGLSSTITFCCRNIRRIIQARTNIPAIKIDG